MIEVDLTLQTPNDQDIAGLSTQQWQTWFGQWVRLLNPELSPIQAYELSLVLTTDDQIQRFNATYRDQDVPTDVLAFALLDQETFVTPAWTEQPTNLGDIIVSLETAARQATERGHELKVELAWLASHGLLHLLGWDHPTTDRLNQMLTQQVQLMTVIGLTPPSWSAEKLGYL
jgi:probable rRNA maturation factor